MAEFSELDLYLLDLVKSGYELRFYSSDSFSDSIFIIQIGKYVNEKMYNEKTSFSKHILVGAKYPYQVIKYQVDLMIKHLESAIEADNKVKGVKE